MPSRLIILDGRLAPVESLDAEVIDLQEFALWAHSGDWLRRIGRYGSVRLLTHYCDCLPRRLFLQGLMRIVSYGQCLVEAVDGKVRTVTPMVLLSGAAMMLRDAALRPRLLREVSAEVGKLESACHSRRESRRLSQSRQSRSRRPFYLKTDLWFGVPAGGSVTHMAGVVNHLGFYGPAPWVLSTSSNPLVNPEIAFSRLEPQKRFWDFRELPALALNSVASDRLIHSLNGQPPGWIYHRYSLHNFSGVKAAQYFGVPLVIEYNGSEVWISRHWGNGLKYRELAERIELLNLKCAELIVVVSQPLKNDLVRRGIDASKVLVNPNGVDVERYSPLTDASQLRTTLGLDAARVIGFIGTFGRWHGAEILIEAFAHLLRHSGENHPLRLVMIGDGLRRKAAESLASRLGIADAVVFTGMVPQTEGPAYLAACDILVAPHIPNEDGSPFFGSPTKLFEYMAMGRAIVASNLAQIGDVLNHGETGWLVEPGSVVALSTGLRAVLDADPLRQRLGENARKAAERKHTWIAHTQRIVEALHARCG